MVNGKLNIVYPASTFEFCPSTHYSRSYMPSYPLGVYTPLIELHVERAAISECTYVCVGGGGFCVYNSYEDRSSEIQRPSLGESSVM